MYGCKDRTVSRSIASDPTFATSRLAPVQSWYGYLEGFSQEFVREVLQRYGPHARTVYDPFAGVGTVPLVASILGLQGYYSEINPVLRLVTAAKLAALNTDTESRARLLQGLQKCLTQIDTVTTQLPHADDLLQSYDRCFGASVFFEPSVLREVLLVRTFIDWMAEPGSTTAGLLTVAAINGLVKVSRLQRAGDLRFKTDSELRRSQESFVHMFSGHLREMITDLSSAGRASPLPALASADARRLDRAMDGCFDVVVTSPPYLNGTNYFRNTKLELWFMRELQSKSDLATFRRQAVTAGINDVSLKTAVDQASPSVAAVYDELSKHAYDRRIPKMVADYFKDMKIIFANLRGSLAPGAAVIIDIGDSIYGGIRVRTDQLLVDILSDLGYRLRDSVTLRKRLSHNGQLLSQVLLVMEWKADSELKDTARHSWDVKWHTFKTNLPQRTLPYSKRNWGHPLHSLCSYEGKMKPSIAHFLVDTFVPPGGTMLDPFAGVGTVPFEAALQGKGSTGFDISPAAMCIARAKLGRFEPEQCRDLVRVLGEHLESYLVSATQMTEIGAFGFNRTLREYFHPDTLREIIAAREFFSKLDKRDPSVSLVMASLLHILHGNRPYALSRRSHPITPYAPSGPYEYRPLIPRLTAKLERSLSSPLPTNFRYGRMVECDSTQPWPQDIRGLDAIVTSPPFFDSTRFHLANWMRLWFCGWSDDDFKQEPAKYVDERQKKGLGLYESIFRQARLCLKPSGVLVMHLGKSKKCDMGAELGEMARPWFRVEDLFIEDVRGCESHGVTDVGTVVAHEYLVLS
jgi:hypothetical protein